MEETHADNDEEKEELSNGSEEGQDSVTDSSQKMSGQTKTYITLILAIIGFKTTGLCEPCNRCDGPYTI